MLVSGKWNVNTMILVPQYIAHKDFSGRMLKTYLASPYLPIGFIAVKDKAESGKFIKLSILNIHRISILS